MKKNVKKQSGEKDVKDSDLEDIVRELRDKVQALEKMVADLMSARMSSSQYRTVTDQLQCRKCSKGFMTKSELQIHIRTNHREKLKCKLCTNYFDKNSDLELHMTTDHQLERIYKCDICQKTFVFEWRLKKHKTLHENDYGKNCHYYNEYADGDESKNCEDCNTFLCSPCLELTELHQKKQFIKHTK